MVINEVTFSIEEGARSSSKPPRCKPPTGAGNIVQTRRIQNEQTHNFSKKISAASVERRQQLHEQKLAGLRPWTPVRPLAASPTTCFRQAIFQNLRSISSAKLKHPQPSNHQKWRAQKIVTIDVSPVDNVTAEDDDY